MKKFNRLNTSQKLKLNKNVKMSYEIIQCKIYVFFHFENFDGQVAFNVGSNKQKKYQFSLV